jgi:hypothetical protein
MYPADDETLEANHQEFLRRLKTGNVTQPELQSAISLMNLRLDFLHTLKASVETEEQRKEVQLSIDEQSSEIREIRSLAKKKGSID